MSKTYETDILIIGSGISALTLGALLHRAKTPFLMVDSLDQIGGRARSIEAHETTIDFGMKSFPVGQNIHANPVLKLKELLDLEFGIEPWTEGPTQFEKGEWRSFFGFGETLQTKLAEELLYYSESPRLMVSGGFGKLISQLTKLIPSKNILLKSQVTQIKADGDILNEVLINGSDTIKFKKLVATIAPLDLISLMPPNLLSQKTLMRLSHANSFTGIGLDLISTDRPFSGKNVLYLSETTEDPTICCGYFTSNIDPLRISNSSSSSSWLTLMDSEDATDDEKVSKQIRVVKRLISRAFPKLLESITWERIIVQPNALGLIPVFQLEKNGSIPGVENLFVAGSIYARGAQSSFRNVPAAIESALVLAQNLGLELEPHTKMVSKVPTEAPSPTV